MFATTRDDDESSLSSEDTFEVMEQVENSDCRTRLMLKHSPKVLTKEKSRKDKSTPFTPLTRRTPRGPPIDHDKKKEKKGYKENARLAHHRCGDKQALISKEPVKKKGYKENVRSGFHMCEDMQALISEEPVKTKEKPSSVRKAPKKEGGKFVKASPRSKMAKLREKEDTAWFENDDIFGFANED